MLAHQSIKTRYLRVLKVLALADISKHNRIFVLPKQVRYQAAPRPDHSLGNAFAG